MKSYAFLIAALTVPLSANAAEITNVDANNCEFYIDGFAQAYNYYTGWSRTAIHAEMVVKDPLVQSVGLFVQYRDLSTGELKSETIHSQIPAAYGPRKSNVEFTLTEYPMPQFYGHQPVPTLREALAVAFFADKPMTNNSIMRMWISNSGQNFDYPALMGLTTWTTSLGRGTMTWLDQSAPVFAQKAMCPPWPSF